MTDKEIERMFETDLIEELYELDYFNPVVPEEKLYFSKIISWQRRAFCKSVFDGVLETSDDIQRAFTMSYDYDPYYHESEIIIEIEGLEP